LHLAHPRPAIHTLWAQKHQQHPSVIQALAFPLQVTPDPHGAIDEGDHQNGAIAPFLRAFVKITRSASSAQMDTFECIFSWGASAQKDLLKCMASMGVNPS
jgi:hypothetical protein